MSERHDALRAVNDAADELFAACRQRRTFREAVNGSAKAPLPTDFLELLGQIEPGANELTIRAVTPTRISLKGKRYGRR